MDMNQIIEMGAKLFKNNVSGEGKGLDLKHIVSALTSLLSNSKGSVDLNSIISHLDAGGLMSVAASWLGDGANAPISASQISSIFGGSKISKFAKQLGLDEGTALKGLTAAIPGIVDKSSQGGSILKSIGGLSDALGGLKGLFG